MSAFFSFSFYCCLCVCVCVRSCVCACTRRYVICLCGQRDVSFSFREIPWCCLKGKESKRKRKRSEEKPFDEIMCNKVCMYIYPCMYEFPAEKKSWSTSPMSSAATFTMEKKASDMSF